MGCGQSKIHLYPRKSKSKANGKKTGHADSDAETDEDEGHIEDGDKGQSREREKNDEAEEQSNKDAAETEEEVSVSLLRAKNLSLLQSQEISSSQQNFFRMLDRKIEEGPDYDSASETEIALEEARLNALVQHWESASLTASICSSASRSLQTTPIRQAPIKQLSTTPRGVLQTTLPLPMPLPQQQQVLTADFLPHGAPQATVQPAGSLKAQQQVMLSHLNTKMLHPLAVMPIPVPQIPISMSGIALTQSDASAAAVANSSNALSLLQGTSSQQAQGQVQQFTHLLNLPSGSPQLLGKPNVSPKRLIDARLLMNPTPLAQQMQPQLQSVQFMPTSSVISSASLATGFVNGGGVNVSGGGRSPQPLMQMAYFGQQPTAQQQAAMQPAASSSQHELQQQNQQQQQQQTPSQSQPNPQAFYGEVIHSVQAPTEYRFPPAISVQRLAPQVQRQLRETQELIKDSCPQLYAAGYGSPGPPIRNQARNPTRRPTLETQFSQELS